LTNRPWRGGLDSKLALVRYSHLDGFISITRDRDAGRVYPDPISGSPRIEYTPSAFDAANNLEGMIATAKVCYVTGATEIHAFVPGLDPFIRESLAKDTMQEELVERVDSGINDPAFSAWLERLRQVGNKPPVTAWSSAHQMGTCRMSRNEDEGVVDKNGKVWGVEDLFVADASVFPSASGVNPMITTMAIADWISSGIGSGLDKEGKRVT
jgi:choline dehydrogenase-like flavoprotein